MKTLLAILRLIRLPLLFATLADAAVVVLLIGKGEILYPTLTAVWLAAGGLYLFAMATNDVLDARRNREAAERGPVTRINPVAAGHLPAPAASAVAGVGVAMALAAALRSPAVNLTMLMTAGALIALYNLGLKRVPAIGLPMLGVIRGAVAALGLVGAYSGVYWAVPAIIGAHTVFVCSFAYAWEGRRPRLYGNNWFHLLAVCAAGVAVLGMAPSKWGVQMWPAGVSLAPVFATWAMFVAVFAAIFARTPRVQRGGVLRFFGLTWLIPLDFAFVWAAGYAQTGVVFAALLAGMFISVQGMRLMARQTGKAAR